MKNKNLLLFVTLLLFTFISQLSTTMAQSPNQFKYQAILRDATGNLVESQQKVVKIDILKGTETGPIVFTETHTVTTTPQGIINLNIGSINQTGIGDINWANSNYYIKITVGGVEMGTSQLMSVPYALTAKTVATFDYPNLTNKPLLFSGSYNDLTNKPIQFNGTWAAITDKPTTISGFGITDSFNGKYSSLSEKPTLSTVATTGNYMDLTNKPIGVAIGDIQYWNGTEWENIEAGLAGQFLQLNAAGIPTWSGATFPSISTANVSSIAATTATGGGNVTRDGGAGITARGICWSTTTNPTIANNKTTDGLGVGTYTSSISGLTATTVYYVRSYCTNSVGTVYGNEVSFKTTVSPSLASLTTTIATNITGTSATLGGEVTSTGNTAVTERGICYSTTANPTTNSFRIIIGSGTGSFSNATSGLTGNTTYYVRAYAINSQGTAYGNEVSFRTSTTLTVASLTTTTPTNITSTTATLGGEVTSDGGAAVTERGICYSLTANPTTSSTKVTIGTGIGSFTNTITGLAANTTYFVRAYAINSQGTAYGSEITFKTSIALSAASLTTTVATNITSTTVTLGGEVTSDGGAAVTERGICYSLTANPTTSSTKVSIGTGIGSYSNSTSGLTANTTYYVRAYAINSQGTAYGNEITFKTSIALSAASLTTTVATNITSTTVTLGGEVTSDGGAAVTERGICYSLTANPTTSSTKVSIGTGTGSYSNSTSGLTANTTYYVRAYAINSQGTAYGSEITFKTSIALSVASLTTTTATNITSTSATLGGNVTSDGGAAVTERGICYSTTTNPTTSSFRIIIGTGTGSYSNATSGLAAGTTYYVRAYAINSQGTAYGNEINLTTLP